MTSLDDRVVTIGIDVGTTNVKSAAFDVRGRTVAGASRRHVVANPQPGWAEYDPDALFTDVAATLREVVAELPEGSRVAGVAVSSMAETAVAIDAHGAALRPAIAWHDERTHEQAAWWRREVGEDVVAQISGLPIVPIFGIHKLMWVRDHEPDVFARIRSWLNVADYVAFRLCGKQATDYSLGSRVMAMDLATRTWSTTLLDACGIDVDVFAELVPSGTAVGEVHAEAATATGLPLGTVVAAGGMDHPCGALAMGVTGEGDLLDSMGTSESIFTVLAAPVRDAELTRQGYQQGPHVVPDRFYCNGGMYTLGACVDWARSTLFADLGDAYATMVADGAAAPPGSDGVHFLPHLRMANTPIDDVLSRGAFVGLTLETDRARMARAVFEGLAYGGQASLDGLVERLGLRVARVRAAGGGTRNPILMEAKAALLEPDVVMEIVDVDEASCLGAAMLAGIGSGVYASVDEATAAVAQAPRIVPRPDAVTEALYRRAYRDVYQQLYPRLAPVSHAIAALGAEADTAPQAAVGSSA